MIAANLDVETVKVMATTLITPKELAEQFCIHPRNAIRFAKQHGLEVLDLGHRTKRIRLCDAEALARGTFSAPVAARPVATPKRDLLAPRGRRGR